MQSPPIAPLFLALCLAAVSIDCKKPDAKKPKSLEPLQWEGIALGQSTAQVKARMQKLQWKVRCQRPNTVVYLDGNALLTRWIKRAERKRTHRCDARHTPPKGQRGRIRAKMLFVDDRLRQLTVVVERDDTILSKDLKRRWGAYRQTDLELYLYQNTLPGNLRAFVFRRQETTVVWLRKVKLHELIFLSHAPAEVSLLRALATRKKGE